MCTLARCATYRDASPALNFYVVELHLLLQESDLHTKRIGHTGFVDKTSEAAKPISLEAPKPKDDVEMEEVGADSSSQQEEMVVHEVNQQLLNRT